MLSFAKSKDWAHPVVMIAFLVCLMVCSGRLSGEVGARRIVGLADLGEAVRDAAPGTVIRIASGEYRPRDRAGSGAGGGAAGISGGEGRGVERFRLEGRGTAEQPVIVEAESPGSAVFIGDFQFVLAGEGLMMRGLTFIENGSHEIIVLDGRHLRFSGNRIIRSGSRTSTQVRMIRVEAGASDCRIDHNYFEGSRAVTIGTVTTQADHARRTRIDHNIFRNITRRSPNGQEPIQLGNGPPELHARRHDAIVLNNLFDHADGDDEVISNKSSGNVIRGNIVTHCRASLWLRGGTDCVVEENLLYRSGGITVLGTDHQIRRNLILLPHHWGIELPTGSPTGVGRAGEIFHRPVGSLVEENTIYLRSATAGIYLRQVPFYGSSIPEQNRIINNLIIGHELRANGRPTILLFDTAQAIDANTVTGQRLYVGEGAEVGSGGRQPQTLRQAPSLEELRRLLPADLDLPLDRRGAVRGTLRLNLLAAGQQAGQPILLDTTLTGPMVERATWRFGDGQGVVSAEPNVIHRFDRPGRYTVTAELIMSDRRRLRLREVINIDRQ